MQCTRVHNEKPLTQGVFSFSTDTLKQTQILPCDELQIDAVVCEQDRVVFTGTDMKEYGSEEAGGFLFLDNQTGRTKAAGV